MNTTYTRTKIPRTVTRLTADQRRALDLYQFANQQEDRYLGSVFVTARGQRDVEDRTRVAYLECKRLGMTTEHGL